MMYTAERVMRRQRHQWACPALPVRKWCGFHCPEM